MSLLLTVFLDSAAKDSEAAILETAQPDVDAWKTAWQWDFSYFELMCSTTSWFPSLAKQSPAIWLERMVGPWYTDSAAFKVGSFCRRNESLLWRLYDHLFLNTLAFLGIALSSLPSTRLTYVTISLAEKEPILLSAYRTTLTGVQVANKGRFGSSIFSLQNQVIRQPAAGKHILVCIFLIWSFQCRILAFPHDMAYTISSFI